MDFKDLLYRAKEGSRDAQEELTRLYHPLLVREAIVDGIFDEVHQSGNHAHGIQ